MMSEVTPALRSRYVYRWTGLFSKPPIAGMAPHPNKVEPPLPSSALPLFLSRVASDNPMSPLLFEGRVEVQVERRLTSGEVAVALREHSVAHYDSRGFMSRGQSLGDSMKDYSISPGRVTITRRWSPPRSLTRTSTRTLLFDGPHLASEVVKSEKTTYYGRSCQYASYQSSACYLAAGDVIVQEMFDDKCINELLVGT